MIDRYYPPEFQAGKFHCALCQVFAQQTFNPVFIHSGGAQATRFQASFCSHCRNWSFWYDGVLIIPSQSPVPIAHLDLPTDCTAEYEEARDVFSKSPRAAAALLRLCIQELMPHLGGAGKNINDDIKTLVANGLPAQIQKALDYCRVVGNNAVHPGEISLNDSPEIAQRLFEMINFIVEDRITRPKEIEALYEKLPEGARAAIEKRDGRS